MTLEGEGSDGAAGVDDDFGFVKDPVPPKERKVDRIALRQEGMRGLIALILLGLVGVTLIWALTTVDSWTEMRELLEIWLPALTGLLGSAVGFYFGTRA